MWFLAGLVGALGLLEVAAAIVGPGATGQAVIEHHGSNLADLGPEAAVGVVFLGDSSVGADVDPSMVSERTGRDAYGLWLPDASPSVIGPLLTEFFGADATTETVVIGLTARMFNETTAIRRLERLDAARASLTWRARAEPGLLTRAERRAGQVSSLFRYRAGLRQPSDWINGARSGGRLELHRDGQITFFENESIDDIRSGYESGERNALADYRVSDRELEVLLALIDELTSDGIDVHVALLPTHDPIYDPFFPTADTDDRFRVRLRSELTATEVDVPIVDLTGLGDQPDLFADGNHLNRRGADAATELLIRHLDGGG